MTEYAIPGEPHQRLPTGVEDWSVDLDYLVLPWQCPVCDQTIAETIVQRRKPEARTVLIAFSPTRQVTADLDGIPFFGPSRRAMRGKSERRAIAKMHTESWLRARGSREYRSGSTMPPSDHGPIELMEFETICDNCPRRLRIRLPSP